jgi:tetratricopeptide (TPR) repeat protein
MLGGLHDPDQLALLYREADVYYRLNDIKSANDRHEYAFNLQRNGTPDDQVDATIRLAKWYEANRHQSAARDLYRRALELTNAHAPNSEVQRAQLHRAIAWTYRSQYYPGTKATEAKTPFRVLTPKPYGIVWRDIEGMTIDPWSREILLRARIALQRSRDTLAGQDSLPSEEMSQTLLDLGDWHLLTRKYGRAFSTYADLYKLLQTSAPSQLESILGKAELLHMRDLGSAVAIPGHTSPTYGVIELEVAVNRMGVARNVRTVRLDPPHLSDRRFRAAMRVARFRPAIIDGVPTRTENVRVTYIFD